jgi:transcriptional repressor NrdR
MQCAFCGFESTRVVDSRLGDAGDSVRRRRECADCGGRFTTYERSEPTPVTVVKRDGRREAFDRQKLLRGLLRAANKRPVTEAQLDDLADSIAAKVRRHGPEIDAQEIGELSLVGLAGLDPVSAILFASVYRQLASLEDLEAEVRRIRAQSVIPSDERRSIADPLAAPPGGSQKPGRSERRGHARQP